MERLGGRRAFLRSACALGVAGVSGCLRLSQESAEGTGDPTLAYEDSDRITWHLPLGDPVRDELHGAVTTDAGPVVYGAKRDEESQYSWLLGRDGDGTERWTRTLEQAGSWAVPTEGVETDDGEVAVVLQGHGGEYADGRLLVVDDAGEVRTRERYTAERNQYLRWITRTSDGTLVLGGARDIEGTTRPWVLGVTPNGETLWELAPEDVTGWVRDLAPFGEGALAAVQGEDTGQIVAVDADGRERRETVTTRVFGLRHVADDYYLNTADGWHRLDDGGAVVERQVFGSRSDWWTPTDGGAILAGATGEDDENTDGLLTAVDESGDERWRERVGGALPDAFHDIVPLPDGGFLAVGVTQSYRSEAEIASEGDGTDGGEGADDGGHENNGWLVRVDP